MELKEAIDILSTMKKQLDECIKRNTEIDDSGIDDYTAQAIETILQELEHLQKENEELKEEVEFLKEDRHNSTEAYKDMLKEQQRYYEERMEETY